MFGTLLKIVNAEVQKTPPKDYGNSNISWCKSKTFHGEIDLAGWVTFQIFPLFWNSPFLRGHVTLIPKKPCRVNLPAAFLVCQKICDEFLLKNLQKRVFFSSEFRK